MVQGVCRQIRHCQIEEELATVNVSIGMKVEDPPKGASSWVVACPAKTGDACLLKRMFSEALVECAFTCSSSTLLPEQYGPTRGLQKWMSHQKRPSGDLSPEARA